MEEETQRELSTFVNPASVKSFSRPVAKEVPHSSDDTADSPPPPPLLPPSTVQEVPDSSTNTASNGNGGKKRVIPKWKVEDGELLKEAAASHHGDLSAILQDEKYAPKLGRFPSHVLQTKLSRMGISSDQRAANRSAACEEEEEEGKGVDTLAVEEAAKDHENGLLLKSEMSNVPTGEKEGEEEEERVAPDNAVEVVHVSENAKGEVADEEVKESEDDEKKDEENVQEQTAKKEKDEPEKMDEVKEEEEAAEAEEVETEEVVVTAATKKRKKSNGDSTYKKKKRKVPKENRATEKINN